MLPKIKIDKIIYTIKNNNLRFFTIRKSQHSIINKFIINNIKKFINEKIQHQISDYYNFLLFII